MKKLLVLSSLCILFSSCMSEYSKSVYGYKYKPKKTGCMVGRRGGSWN